MGVGMEEEWKNNRRAGRETRDKRRRRRRRQKEIAGWAGQGLANQEGGWGGYGGITGGIRGGSGFTVYWARAVDGIGISRVYSDYIPKIPYIYCTY
jgi:hypothetical protein